jgi:hypothetical protein
MRHGIVSLSCDKNTSWEFFAKASVPVKKITDWRSSD